MMDQMQISDEQERRRVLDPARSFIVQAPAGSGKTALLIQRYLRLLAYVDEPEEIIAITFTRKAAAEMRFRILAALDAPAQLVEVETAYGKLNRELAAAAQARDREKGWKIAENPERLRIQTIDSLCASLTQQMPLLSSFGAQPEISSDAFVLYHEAARATLDLVQLEHPVAEDVACLLEHLDNDLDRAESLLVMMLARRDLWLRHMHARPREELELALQRVRCQAAKQVLALFPDILREELVDVTQYAAANLLAEGKESPIAACHDLTALNMTSIEQWRGIAELLLTNKGEWRKRISIKEGFPSYQDMARAKPAKDWKSRWQALIDALISEDDLRQYLQEIRHLPQAHYSDQQWQILGAIMRLLLNAVAQLKVVFQVSGCVDFSEIAQRAFFALGEPDSPTDLALALNYRIKHLMIDEFQDTSISQYQLIEKLISGWEEGEGRSLFAVGDPMQSIYRFREAEVGLFLQVQKKGIGQLILEPVTLKSNFRSQQGIVDWVNDTFTMIMPAIENIATGAVAYSASTSTLPRLNECAVRVYPFISKDHAAEAQQVVEIIAQARCRAPDETIAILVRNRSHLTHIVAAIKQSGLRFRAVEIEALHQKSLVQDLLMLTRALINPADRLAWFAVLRAPWCGLLLREIAVLSDIELNDCEGTVRTPVLTPWGVLCDENRWPIFSDDALMRIRRVREILRPAMDHRMRQSLRDTVEVVWEGLGGPGCVLTQNAEQHAGDHYPDDALIFFNYLENQENAMGISDLDQFELGLASLYASPDLNADETLQIMTIHKAKGLEFDTVILPGLERVSRNQDKHLLKWLEQPYFNEEDVAESISPDLLLAPIRGTETNDDLIYNWIEKFDKGREDHELKRLLYVAATRARKFLHLLGNVDVAEDNGEKLLNPPRAGSLLRCLWPILDDRYHEELKKRGASSVLDELTGKINPQSMSGQRITRLKSSWSLPVAPNSVDWQIVQLPQSFCEEIEFSWASDWARHVGNIVHHWLQRIAEDGLKNWGTERITHMHDQFRQNLIAEGMLGSIKEMEYAVERITQALANTISDERGQWILRTRESACNEFKVSGLLDGEIVNFVIDRTFCESDGVRWIIDYKTSSHEGGGIEDFLDREVARYRDQLNQYAELMRYYDSKEIKLGIFFPLMNEWREW